MAEHGWREADHAYALLRLGGCSRHNTVQRALSGNGVWGCETDKLGRHPFPCDLLWPSRPVAGSTAGAAASADGAPAPTPRAVCAAQRIAARQLSPARRLAGAAEHFGLHYPTLPHPDAASTGRLLA